MDYRIPPSTGPISLRRFDVGNVSRTYEWVCNSWYTKDFAGSATPNPDTHVRYFQKVLADENQIFLAVYEGMRHVGNAGLKYFDTDSCECWYYIGDESRRGRGYANTIVDILSKIAFSIDTVNRIRARVLLSNVKSSKALLANGFERSGITLDERGRVFVLYEKQR